MVPCGYHAAPGDFFTAEHPVNQGTSSGSSLIQLIPGILNFRLRSRKQVYDLLQSNDMKHLDSGAAKASLILEDLGIINMVILDVLVYQFRTRLSYQEMPPIQAVSGGSPTNPTESQGFDLRTNHDTQIPIETIRGLFNQSLIRALYWWVHIYQNNQNNQDVQ